MRRNKPQNRQPLRTKMLTDRVSNIWPIQKHLRKNIVPQVTNLYDEEAQQRPKLMGKVDTKTHTIRLRSKSDAESESHETAHAIHFLLAPDKVRKRLFQNSTKLENLLESIGGYSKHRQREILAELIGNLAHSENERIRRIGTWGKITREMHVNSKRFEGKFILGTKIMTRNVEVELNRKSVDQIYQNHGVDGVILLMASPPNIFGHLEMKLWERQMIKDKILTPNGGLTEKGFDFLRKTVTIKTLEKRLLDAINARPN